ncbi:MAG: uroporphyrinogen decarboxylase family protein [Phycisphaerae bacterium]
MIDYLGRTRRTVNFLKTILFDYPEWTPARVNFLPAAWIKHRERLEELVLAHPRVFPGFKKGSVDFDFTAGIGNPLYELGRHTDCWGTVWNNIARGFDSQVDVEPLADWAAFDEWKKRLPDPMKDDQFGPRTEWDKLKANMDRARAAGGLAESGPLPHGFFFMRLYYLRGLENLMVDMATGEERLGELIRIIEDYSAAVIRKVLDLGAELVGLGEDLGMQTALPISPAMWRKYVKPTYEATIGLCRDRGVLVYLHSDGHILEIIPDLIEVGVRMLNPQIRANGLAGLRKYARGKVALSQDLDRQLFPFATPSQVEDHIGEVFEGLYMKEGGLALQGEVGPEVPLENVEAICRAMEKLCNLPEPEVT